MEMIFPTDVGYRAAFAVGFRKRPGAPGTTERVGTVILKRTYEIHPDADPGTESLTPSADAFEVFFADDPTTPPFRYESDMVPFKPRSDVIVLGFADDPGNDSLEVDGLPWLKLSATRPNPAPDLFGWAPRNKSTRNAERGSFSDDKNDYPPLWPVPVGMGNRAPLPGNFDNLFYNGYSREATTSDLGYLPAAGTIEIDRPDAGENYQFSLRGDTASAALLYAAAGLPDIPTCWENMDVTMPLDTLVIEPEDHRCYAVWRGVWDFDVPAPDRYRRLVVTASA